MRTVSQVSELTGISVRTLQYYDEIGLFKPTRVTQSGYRLYDDDALGVLQQILFFKELDFKLKDIMTIMRNPNYDKKEAYENQKRLITAKRNRMNRLLDLLNKLIKGEDCMSFKEFDMSEYFNALAEFKNEHPDEIIKVWGSMDKFNEMTEKFKEKETEIAKAAIMQYGSIEKYTEAMKKNLNNFSGTMEKLGQIKENSSNYIQENNELMKRLTADLSKDVSSEEIQGIIGQLVELVLQTNRGIDMGENFWNLVVEAYTNDTTTIGVTDKLYGQGAAEFIGKAYKIYFKKP